MNNETKAKFLSVCPVLASENVSRDLEWYESFLGYKNVFDSSQYQKGEIDYAVICRDDLCLHLQWKIWA